MTFRQVSNALLRNSGSENNQEGREFYSGRESHKISAASDAAGRSCRPKGLFRQASQIVIFFAISALCPRAFAQGPLPDAPMALAEPAAAIVITPRSSETTHKFWDRQNRILFAAAAVSNAADFAVTRANLQSGGQELNPVVRIFGRSTPGLALNFAGETAGVVSLSYFFHKTGHHRLERITPLVNFAASAGAVSYGLAHR
jgi:hypothetical protein